ncbi:stress response protein NST1-like [Acipenser oxyrinchus oxyrinchus]|uniref:Stress response protein NST1-like n=1 Tax=Acipenser oxyrinchus oxyrinchus TaxID=40147 RepID=A0AAD8D3H1_ACIOX|nr:stress response protein NST1-like [Acipenser oxyrinchus oxyrinchus]
MRRSQSLPLLCRAGNNVGVPRRSWSLDHAPGSRSPHKPRLASSTRAKENIQTVSSKPQEPILIGDPPWNVLKVTPPQCSPEDDSGVGLNSPQDAQCHKVRSLMRQRHFAERAKALPTLAFNLHRNIGSLEDTSEEMRKLRIMLDKELLTEGRENRAVERWIALNEKEIPKLECKIQDHEREYDDRVKQILKMNEEIEQIQSRGQMAYNKILSLKEEIKKLQKKLSNLDKVVDGEAFIQQYEEEYGEEPEEKRKGNNQDDQEEAEQKEERMEAKNPRREVKRKQTPKGTTTKEDKISTGGCSCFSWLCGKKSRVQKRKKAWICC